MDPQIIVALIAQTGAILAILISTRRKLSSVGDDAREARDQTANSHGTNLRDDVDNVDGKVVALSGQMHGLARTLHRIEGWVRDLTDADAQLEDTIDRRKIAAQRELMKLRDDIPEIIRTELGQHAAECPLRGPQIGG